MAYVTNSEAPTILYLMEKEMIKKKQEENNCRLEIFITVRRKKKMERGRETE
jgi:hypothetical protein